MTPKEKAKELANKFTIHVQTWDCYWDAQLPDEDIMKDCKACALIAVDEILNLEGNYLISRGYWEQVKQEINNL